MDEHSDCWKKNGEQDKKEARFTVGFNRTVLLFPRHIIYSHQFETKLHVFGIFHDNLNDISNYAIVSTIGTRV